ncbi:hypothetical protein KFL_001750050 [Klebsormidium nitens]|uniref:Endonuclease/exonuclease/phosphatase domain-containing protein n=1 Tax=Klebsormidium nitens TaxID=105231 RepID=A0A1Y1I7I6_KLENI|nr:hypothetical protein KFL_001750050 [Klebsormidium nitens]|eukprot:GAQ84068.1 hypothetical protein KFL_001750050 [Klebsormidium nitens]
MNPDGAARCTVCNYAREKTRVVDKGQESEGERKRKRETTEMNGGSLSSKDAGESGTKAGDGKRSGHGDGNRTVIDLEDNESPQRKSNQKGNEGGAQLDEIAGAGGSGPGPTGASLLHQLHRERLARLAAKQKGGASGDASTSNPGPSGAKTGHFSQKEKLGGNAVGGGVRERAGSSTFSRPDLEPTQTSASTRNFASTSGGSGPAPSAKASGSAVSSQSAASFDPLVILSYNVWFNESVQLQQRMAAVGAIIEEHSPDVIFFQEVTPNIYSIFRQARWWARGRYKCSLTPAEIDRQYFAMMVTRVPVKAFRHEPFRNSVMGRDLVTAKADMGDDLELTLATTHLESPTGRDQMFSEPRVAQARTALSRLSPERNVIFGGDMNWNDQRDGPVPLPDCWIDPWLELHRGQPGYTYDSVLNQMLLGTLKGRLDRFFCRLTDFSVRSIEMVGREPLPGVTYEKPGWGRNPKSKTLPVLPSDHFGLLLKVARKGR